MRFFYSSPYLADWRGGEQGGAKYFRFRVPNPGLRLFGAIAFRLSSFPFFRENFRTSLLTTTQKRCMHISSRWISVYLFRVSLQASIFGYKIISYRLPIVCDRHAYTTLYL